MTQNWSYCHLYQSIQLCSPEHIPHKQTCSTPTSFPQQSLASYSTLSKLWKSRDFIIYNYHNFLDHISVCLAKTNHVYADICVTSFLTLWHHNIVWNLKAFAPKITENINVKCTRTWPRCDPKMWRGWIKLRSNREIIKTLEVFKISKL